MQANHTVRTIIKRVKETVQEIYGFKELDYSANKRTFWVDKRREIIELKLSNKKPNDTETELTEYSFEIVLDIPFGIGSIKRTVDFPLLKDDAEINIYNVKGGKKIRIE